MKFNELFNKTDSNLFNILNSQQIKVLLKGEILNLNKSQNEFLESEIYLIYLNMTKELKVKIENSLINFQGFIVNFNSLVENETKIYETLNYKEIFEILKVKTILEVGQKLKNETNFYVNRIFSLNVKNLKQSKIINKNSSELFLKAQNEKIILLSDNSGNGKSTTFKILALEMKIKFPLKWIQYVNMRNFIEIYENFNFDIFKVLIRIFDMKTLFEKNILEKILKDSNFVIFWDGFDEISPIYTEKSLKIMQMIKNDTNSIQFIATRPHYAINITNALNIDTVTKMMPYKRNERDEFLMKYFAYKNLTKIKSKIATNYSIKLIKKIQSEERGFVGSPLLLSMIAKVSLTNVDLKNQPKNFYEIYEYFTKINLEITVSKGNIMEEIKNGFLSSRDKNLLVFHQYYAFRFLFPNLNEKYKQLEIFKRYEKIPKSNVTILAHFGLVTVDIGGNVEFIHRTFAEFFVFQYFVDNFYEFEGDASQKEKTFRLDLMIEKLIESDYEELTKFSKSYLKNSKFMFEGKIFKIFGKSMQKRIASGFEEFFNSVDEYDEFFRFGKSLWNFNENLSYFNVIAIKSPFDYPSNFNKYLKQVQKKFPYDKKQQDLILYGKNLRGNFLLAAFREHLEYRDDFNMKEFLIKTKVNSTKGTQIIVNDFKKFQKFSDFYYFIKPILTIDERKRIFTDGLFEFFHNETQIVGIFDELKELFTEEEIKNYFCTQIENLNLNLDETKLEPEHLDKIDLMFEKCGTIQKTDEFLYSRKDSKYCSRINFYNSSNLNQFYAIWNYVGKNFKNKQKKLLREPVCYLEGGCSSFHFFSRVFFTAEDSQIFLEVIEIYKENFDQNEIIEFCVETMYDIAIIPQYPHNEENVKIFVDLIHELKLEKKEKIQQYLIKFCTRFRIRKQEPLNGNYPLIVLLKQIVGEKKFNDLQKPRTVCEVKN
ncbi:hypothetical protein PVAND_015476 [Polypedilum vanderplanki]|nr:hypothetical protein PVAND_015476 [Polypedilum vanderplanki]